MYTIQSIPSLKVLDHQRITQTEKDRARRLASSAAGVALESDVQGEAGRQKTFSPGGGESAEESFTINFTSEEKGQIRQMIANASSPTEIDEIERSVKRGIFPSVKNGAKNIVNVASSTHADNRKRPPSPYSALNSTDVGEGKLRPAEKKVKT